jgi:hypothetical protein
MPISQNPLNVSGLAALAGNRIGGLGLNTQARSVPVRPPANLGGPRSAAGADTAQQDKMELEYAKLDEKKRQFDASMNAKKEKDVDDFRERIEREAIEEAETKEEDTLNKKIAATQMYLTSPEIIQSEENTQLYVDTLVDNGIFDPEEADQFLQMSPDDRMTTAKAQMAISGKAIKIKQDKASSTGGNVKVVSADGTVIEYTPSTTTTTTKAQTAITDADETLAELENLKSTFSEDFVGGWGLLKGQTLQKLDWLSNIPGADEVLGLSEANKDWLHNKTQFSSNVLALAMSYIKQLSGVQYSDKQLEFMKKFVPMTEDSPTEAQGKMDALSGKLERLKELKQDILKRGIAISEDPDSAFADAFSNATRTALASAPVKKDSNEYSEEDLRYTAEKHGMTVEEVRKLLKEKE